MAFDYRTAESLILKIVNSSNTFKEFDALVKLHKPNFQWESKATDADGDLVTMTVFGNTIEYIRRTHPDDVDGKDDGVFHYVINKLIHGCELKISLSQLVSGKRLLEI